MGKVKDLSVAIEEFNEADSVYREKEKELAGAIQGLVSHYVNEGDLDGLNSLVDILPKRFRGVRRIYQAMIEVEDANQD